VTSGVVNKSGSWFTWGEEKIGQGREAARRYLKTHPEITEKIEKLVRESLSSVPSAPVEDHKIEVPEEEPEE